MPKKTYNLIIELNERQIEVLKIRWGQYNTLAETAKKIGVTPERVRQVEAFLAMKIIDAIEKSEGKNHFLGPIN